jgi:hypothetical protein
MPSGSPVSGGHGRPPPKVGLEARIKFYIKAITMEK